MTLIVYCEAVLKKWWGSMGSAFFTLLGIAALLSHKVNDWFVYIAFLAAVFFLFGGTFYVWNDKRKELLEEEAKNGKPKFKMDVSEFVLSGNLESQIGFTYYANTSVINVSPSKSTIRSVYMRTQEQTGKFKASQFVSCSFVRYIPVPVPFGLEGTMTSPVTSHIKDGLHSLNTEPLERGHHKDAWLQFSDVPYTRDEKIFYFYIEDAYGDEHGPFQASTEMGDCYVQNR
jgi:hypothetical protein